MTRSEAERIIAASHADAFVRETDLVAALAVLREPVPAASVVGDGPRTIHFEQDGAYFAFRDRPFYRTAFDAMTDDGMSLGVCASFACKAPMRVRDFDMQAADQAAAWFVAECGRYGFKAERAPDYMSQPEVREHPECERDDLARCHIDCAEMSIADFAALRAVGAADPASAMVSQPCQQQQASAARVTAAQSASATAKGCNPDAFVAVLPAHISRDGDAYFWNTSAATAGRRGPFASEADAVSAAVMAEPWAAHQFHYSYVAGDEART